MIGPLDRADPESAQLAARALANGAFVVLAESSQERSEGSLALAAQFVRPDAVHLLSTQAHGVVQLSLTDEGCAELGLDALIETDHNWQPTKSITHRSVTGRGASTQDRARTTQAAIDPASDADDFVQGGYVFPPRARSDGVLRRAGRTEASVDLSRLAGCIPASVLGLVINDDGSVARGAELVKYAERLGLQFVTVGDVIALRRLIEKLVERFTSVRLPTSGGEFLTVGFRERLTGAHHVALVKGDVERSYDVLVRVHAECLVGDVFRAESCSCSQDLRRSLELIEGEGLGVVVYLVGPDRDRRFDRHAEGGSEQAVSPMDEYGIGAQILANLGLRTIRILTNHPRPISGLAGFGLEVGGCVPLNLSAGSANGLM